MKRTESEIPHLSVTANGERIELDGGWVPETFRVVADYRDAEVTVDAAYNGSRHEPVSVHVTSKEGPLTKEQIALAGLPLHRAHRSRRAAVGDRVPRPGGSARLLRIPRASRLGSVGAGSPRNCWPRQPRCTAQLRQHRPRPSPSTSTSPGRRLPATSLQRARRGCSDGQRPPGDPQGRQAFLEGQDHRPGEAGRVRRSVLRPQVRSGALRRPGDGARPERSQCTRCHAGRRDPAACRDPPGVPGHHREGTEFVEAFSRWPIVGWRH